MTLAEKKYYECHEGTAQSDSTEGSTRVVYE